MTEYDHLIVRDRLYAEHWKHCAEVIEQIVVEERALGPFAVAERQVIEANAGSAPWSSDQFVSTEPKVRDNITEHVRKAEELYSLRAEIDLSPATRDDLVTAVSELAQELMRFERNKIVKSTRRTQQIPWNADSVRGVVEARVGTVMHDLIINQDHHSAATLENDEMMTTLKNAVRGSIIKGRLGHDIGHLLIPTGALKIYEAGGVTFSRPRKDRFRIESVIAVELRKEFTAVQLTAVEMKVRPDAVN